MEENNNKYWIEEDKRKYVFCEIGKDCLTHYVKECEITRDWFETIGKDNTDERISGILEDELDDEKEKVLIKL